MKLFRTPEYRKNFAEKYTSANVLDLGCGSKKTSGSVGVDYIKFSGVDIVHDLNNFPYPFPVNHFDAIILNHVIEHLDSIVNTIREVHRILKVGGKVWIVTPHFTDSHSWIDPTHKSHLSINSFCVFCKPASELFEQELAYITLKGRWRALGYEYFINNFGKRLGVISKKVKKWEERHCFKRRGGEMFFILKKI